MDEGPIVSDLSSHVKAASTLLSAGMVLACLAAGCQPANKYVPPPPPEVTVSQPIRQSVMSYLEYTGTTKAIETVDLRARVKGFLKQRLFREGEDVKEGQLLLVIDEEPFQVALQIAEAKLEAARAGLKKAEESKTKEVAKAQLNLNQAVYQLARVEENRPAKPDPAERRLAGRPGQGRGRSQEVRGPGRGRQGEPRAGPGRLRDEHAHREGQRRPGRGGGPERRARPRLLPHPRPVQRPDQPRQPATSATSWATGRPTVLATIVQVDPIYAYMTRQRERPADVPEAGPGGQAGRFPEGADPRWTWAWPTRRDSRTPGRIDYADPTVDPARARSRSAASSRTPGRATDLPGPLLPDSRARSPSNPDALLGASSGSLGYDQGGWFLLVVDGENRVEQRVRDAGRGRRGPAGDRGEPQAPTTSWSSRACSAPGPGIAVNPRKQELTVATAGSPARPRRRRLPRKPGSLAPRPVVPGASPRPSATEASGHLT